MRIITGKYKGRTIDCPKNSNVRPTLDRTKQTLFNILNFDIPETSVLDLFAGSGQLGFECLSRGSSFVAFCDNDQNCVKAIKAFAEKIGAQSACEVVRSDFGGFLATSRRTFDVIFIDPPYESNLYLPSMESICRFRLLNKGGVVVCEHKRGENLPDVVGVLRKSDSRDIGTVCFDFYRLEEQQQ